MIKKVFFVIIILILFFDLYETLNIQKYISKNDFKKINNDDSDSDSDDLSVSSYDSEDSTVSNNESFVNIKNHEDIIAEQQNIIKYQQNIIKQQDEIPTIVHPTQKHINTHNDEIDINQFGKPYDYKPHEFVHWEFYDPKPWTKIIYKFGTKDPYNFYIKAKIPSLNDYENWINYITNINFDPRSGEIIISCEDEETALSVANLLVSNFRGDISFEEIVKKDLVGISILKCKKYEVVKNKIKDQIIQNMIVKASNFNDLNKQMEQKSKTVVTNVNDKESNNYFYYNNDISKKNNEYEAYDGDIYSFLH